MIKQYWSYIFVILVIAAASSAIWYEKITNRKQFALAKAEIITAQVLADRAIYTREIVQKLETDGKGAHQFSETKPGYIMLPAQMIRKVANRVSKDKNLNYRYRLLSEWNINPNQGLDDAFDIWAWARLKEQEDNFKVYGIKPGARGFPWQPVYRFENSDEKKVLRYMRADPASARSCVECHNAWEQTPSLIERRKNKGQEIGKQWKLHELMGALSIVVPLE